MAIVVTAAHSTPADDTFSASGASAWNASQAVSFTGLTANALVYSSDTTTLAQSSGLTFTSGTTLTAPIFAAGDGSIAAPSIRTTTSGNAGFYSTNAGAIACTAGNTDNWTASGVNFRWGSSGVAGWSSGSSYTTNLDTAFSRISAGLIGVGTGAAASVAGSLSMNNCKAVSYTVGTTAGASGTFTSVTVVNGIVTAGT